MKTLHRFLWISTIAYTVILAEDALKIVKTVLPTCTVTTNRGTVDLKPLAKNDGSSAAFTLSHQDPESGTISVDWNPCYEFTKSTCTSTEVCLGEAGQYFGFGPKSNASFAIVSGQLALKYPQPDNTENTEMGDDTSYLIVLLDCDKDADTPAFTVDQWSGDGVQLKLKSKQCCVQSGLSGGSILIIISVVLLLVYLIVGVLVMKFIRKAQGVEIIPNANFWSSVPGYVKEGTKFTLRGFKVAPAGSSYESI